MIKLAAISPRTNNFIEVNQGDSSPEQQQYDQLFSEMAHATFGAKSPELAESILHFKVLESKLEDNSGIGIFICKLANKNIHVPVIMVQGSVKSPDVFFSPDSNSYFPLNTKWISKFKNEEEVSLGTPADISKLDLTQSALGQVTSPPTARNKFSSYDVPLIASRVPNRVKLAMSKFLAGNRAVLNKAVKYHGSDILKSLTPHITKTSSPTKSWFILDGESSADTYRAAFGGHSKLAFQQALTHGFAYADFRKNAGVLVKNDVKTPTALSVPKESGIYKILKTDGSYVLSLIINNPIHIDEESQYHDYKYLVILENGDYICTDEMIALPSAESLDSDSQMYKRLSKAKKSNGLQALVSYKDGVLYSSTSPANITNITKRKDGVTIGKVGARTLIFNSLYNNNTIVQPKGEATVFVPDSYNSLPLRNKLDSDGYVRDASQALSIIDSGISKEASRKISLRLDTIGDWTINGSSVGGTKEALFKLATLGCGIEAGHKTLSNSRDGYTHTYSLIPVGRLHKLASIFGPSAAADPSMMEQPLPPDMAQQEQPPQMDPQTGEPIDPQTGLPIDPQSGMPYNPETGMLVDVNTGQEIDPETGEPAPSPEEQQLMEQAAQANDQLAMDSALAATLISEANMPELVAEYLPKLQTALDSLNRVLLTVQMKQESISSKLGIEEYSKLENSLRKVSQGLGDIILRLENNSTVFRESSYGAIA